MLRYFATGPDLPIRTDDSVDGAFKSYRMRIILTITLAYAISYTCRLAINIVKKPLIDQGINGNDPTDAEKNALAVATDALFDFMGRTVGAEHERIGDLFLTSTWRVWDRRNLRTGKVEG